MSLSFLPILGAAKKRGPDHAGRIFMRTILITGLIVGVTFILSPAFSQHISAPAIQKRDLVFVQDEECHLVHHAKDQCAFVKLNCEDEEPGYFSYLQLYYCTLSHVKSVAFFCIAVWLSLLFSTIGLAASDFFSVNLSSIATMAGMSENLAGVTLLALGNGSPDVFSTFAAMKNNSGSLAIGELIGAAGFITSVVAGSMAFIRPFQVPKKSFIRDVSFFIIAAGFALAVLADGKLHLWECIMLVVLYIFYVIVVVCTHWYFQKRRKRRQAEAAARSHFNYPGSGTADLGDEYHDDEDDRDPRDRSASIENLDSLERQGYDEDDDEQEELGERIRSQLSSQMRLRRPTGRGRSHTNDPIRPSLLGALEFRTVISNLQREGNLQAYPLQYRTSLDEHNPPRFDRRTTVSEPYFHLEAERVGPERPSITRTASGNRARAGSLVEAGTSVPRNLPSVPRIDLQSPTDGNEVPNNNQNAAQSFWEFRPPPSPVISISPPPSEQTHDDIGPTDQVPPHVGHAGPENPHRKLAPPSVDLPIIITEPPTSPEEGRTFEARKLSLSTPHSPDGHEFPPYADDSFPVSPMSIRSTSPFRLPQPALSHNIARPTNSEPIRVFSFWPYQLLPPPSVVFSTLFPTLYSWNNKNAWGKLFGILSAPSVFLLTLTLPVVEIDKPGDDDRHDMSIPVTASSSQVFSRPIDHHSSSRLSIPGSTTTGHGVSPIQQGMSSAHGTSAQVGYTSTTSLSAATAEYGSPTMERAPEQDDWNRWLVILQMFTAPLFCVIIVWANIDLTDRKLLLHASLISISCSLLLVLFIVYTTRVDRAPKWHGVLCVLGFCVSIAWISTIAGEVVGVLKALGVIFNISDAILGLTIFAVGNSLGDLVADITVAKLGYSVMALSACFGGPMLNILLGIGISGAYITIHGAEKRRHKHPGGKLHFKPYVVEVDRTLMISGIALLVTLIGLLIVVPYRRWKMDRTVGWGLIGLWVISTAGNLVIEIVFGQKKMSMFG